MKYIPEKKFLLYYTKMLNILPINDVKTHIPDVSCECRPTVIETDGGIIILHQSFYEQTHSPELLTVYLN